MHTLFIFGTRPEAIKLFPLCQVFRAHGERVSLLSTAQHTDLMSDVVSAFSLSPDITLAHLKKGRSMTDLLRHILALLPRHIRDISPDAIVVQGDTASAFCGALVGFLMGVPVIHVEAGLRTYDTASPYPEEAFRRSIATFASIHFAPNDIAREHLMREGVSGEIYVVGNTVLDALATLCPPRKRKEPPYAILTTHRRESEGDGRVHIFEAVADIAQKFPDLTIFYPVHKTPTTARLAEEMLSSYPNIRLLSPLSPSEFYPLLSGASFLLTDSGGISEEGAALGIATFVLRDKTEREHELKCGKITLVGTERETILRAVSDYMEKGIPKDNTADMPMESPSRRILEILQRTTLWNATARPKI